MKRILAAISLAIAFAASSTAQNAKSQDNFVIDENRPYVYLVFDHMGKGPRFGRDEPSTRIWFKLINNCRVPIRVRTFGTPRGSLKGEVGVLHDVVRDVETAGVTSDLDQPRSTKELPKMPVGYMTDVSSVAVIAPNDSLLFSVPTTHLNGNWHIEIPYDFEVRTGKCCRPENVGGEPMMVLHYGSWYLPKNIRRELGVER